MNFGMLQVLSLIIWAFLVQTAIAQDITLAFGTFKLSNGGIAYAYAGSLAILGNPPQRPSEAMIVNFALQAATKMRQDWRDNRRTERMGTLPSGMPFAISAFWTSHQARIFFHSSVKRASGTALLEMLPNSIVNEVSSNMADIVATALEDCGGASKHNTYANCGEVMVINRWALANPDIDLVNLEQKYIATAGISNTDDRDAFILRPCDPWRDNSQFGCKQFLEKLKVRECRNQKRDVMGAAAPIPRARVVRLLERREGKAGDAASKKKKATSKTTLKKATSGGKGSAADSKEPVPPKKKQTAAEMAALVWRSNDACGKPPTAAGGSEPPYKCPAGQEPQLKKQAKSGKMLPVLKKNKKTGKMEPVCVRKGSQPTTGGSVKPAVGKPAGGKATGGKSKASKRSQQ